MKCRNEVNGWMLGSLLGAATLLAVLCQGAPPAASATTVPTTAVAPPAAAKDPANYVVRVQWKDARGITNHLQVLTTDGSFSLDTMQPGVKINDADVPATLRLKGTLSVLSPEKGRLELFLGRTVPYVTSTSTGPGGKNSTYQQLQVGLSSSFVVTFGRPLIIQADANEEVSILVRREEG